MEKIFTRFGDGSPAELTAAELMEDLIAGTEDAADRGKIPALSQDEVNRLDDIFKSSYNFFLTEPLSAWP